MPKRKRAKVKDWIVAYLIPHRVWLAYRQARHPVSTYYRWKKWRAFPEVGELITYHDEGPYKVLAVDGYGDLDIEIDGVVENVNWMACCGKPGINF